MLDFLFNPWVSGIGASLVAGLIVTFVTQRILSKRGNREYNQRILTANNEIMYTLRPSISEKQLPPIAVVESVISATSKKYEVIRGDLYSIESLIDDLIKEIMDSGFLSSQQKIEFCEQVSSLTENKISASSGEKLRTVHAALPPIDHSRQTLVLSVTLGLMTGFATIMVLLTYLITRREVSLLSPSPFEKPQFVLLFLTAISFPILITLLLVMVRQFLPSQRRSVEKASVAREGDGVVSLELPPKGK